MLSYLGTLYCLIGLAGDCMHRSMEHKVTWQQLSCVSDFPSPPWKKSGQKTVCLLAHRKAHVDVCLCAPDGTSFGETQSEPCPLWANLQQPLSTGWAPALRQLRPRPVPLCSEASEHKHGGGRTVQLLFVLHGGFCCFLSSGMLPAPPPPLVQLHLSVPAPAARA